MLYQDAGIVIFCSYSTSPFPVEMGIWIVFNCYFALFKVLLLVVEELTSQFWKLDVLTINIRLSAIAGQKYEAWLWTLWNILMVVVTISTLAKPLLLREEPVLVVRLALLLPGELVGFVVERLTPRKEMIRLTTYVWFASMCITCVDVQYIWEFCELVHYFNCSISSFTGNNNALIISKEMFCHTSSLCKVAADYPSTLQLHGVNCYICGIVIFGKLLSSPWFLFLPYQPCFTKMVMVKIEISFVSTVCSNLK